MAREGERERKDSNGKRERERADSDRGGDRAGNMVADDDRRGRAEVC